MAIASANVDQMRLLRLHWIPAFAGKTQASDFASGINLLPGRSHPQAVGLG